MKSAFKLVRVLAVFTQLGFTLITPPVVLALLGWWLQQRFSLGTWVMLTAIVLGLLTSAASAYRFYRRLMGAEKKRTAEREETGKTVVYYTHE